MSSLLTGLRQPDARSCGAASLVAARMLLDPLYAARTAAPARFADEVLAMHRRVTGPVDLDGRLQLPWPRSIGTPPWAVARQLSATGGPDVAPTPYRWRWVRSRPGTAPGAIRNGLATGRPVALYVGDRLLPRHLLLAVEVGPGVLEIYDPARGAIVAVPDPDWAAARLGFGRWTRPWFVVTPR